MRRKRTSAFIIDFIIMIIAFSLINYITPTSKKVTELQAKENEIIEEYTSGKINFNEYFSTYSSVFYELDQEQKVNNLSYLIFIILYFILLPFLWKGRTLGCFINGIQIERFDKGSLFIHQLLIRNIIVIGLGYLIIRNIGIFLIPSKYYFMIISIVGLLQIVLAIFSANMIMFTKEKRGLQDLISNTEITKIINIRKS